MISVAEKRPRARDLPRSYFTHQDTVMEENRKWKNKEMRVGWRVREKGSALSGAEELRERSLSPGRELPL